MEATTLLVWTRLFVNEEADDATEGEVADIQVFRNTDGKLTEFSTPVDNDLKVKDWVLEAGTWTERLERVSIELPIRAEEFNHELLEFYAGSWTAEYSGEEFEVEDGNGTCWGGTYRVDKDGAITEV